MKPKPTTRHCLVTLGAAFTFAAAASGQVSITTADGTTGADNTLFNDSNKGPTDTSGGGGGSVELRNYQTTRMRFPIIRFDLSDLDTSGGAGYGAGATISLSQEWGQNRSRDWLIYGLRDGYDNSGVDANETENWVEGSTSYDNAPGTLPSGLGTYALDIYDAGTNPTGAWELLHTEPSWGIAGIGGGPATMPTADLQAFIEADTDGQVTFLLVTSGGGDSSQYYGIYAKEKGGITAADFPTLVLPSGSYVDSDVDGLPDFWEVDNWGDIVSYGGADDPDGDGSDNATEWAAGTDPTNPLSSPGDADADGLQDAWETASFGDLSQDGSGDPDNDKCTNEEEETAVTDPNDRNSFVDTDTDGVSDGWENLYMGDLVSITATTDDNDGDGEDAATEFSNYSNPNNIDSIAGDIDGDDVPDLWEDQYYGNNDGFIDDTAAGLAELAGTDGTTDGDGDTFTDLVESTAVPVPSDPFDVNSVPGDADGDALDDTWELTYFLDIYGQNGSDDSDGDLYTNEEEENAGTFPDDFLDFIDSDGDFVNDRWEELYYGDLTTITSDTDDTDGDGVEAWEEYEFGSDPTNVDSVPGDIDGDDLDDDLFEYVYFSVLWNNEFALTDFDGNDDPDGDGATNEEEENAFTDPTDRTSAPDSDTDGLGDAWEIASFGDLITTDLGTDDNDGDGEDNATEFANGTNGNDALSTTDSDFDRLPDGWENNYFGDLSQNANDDTDGDGDINLLELRLGTNPNDAGSVSNPDTVGTANLLGGDIDLQNDSQGTGALGNNSGIGLRTLWNARVHLPMFRVDLSNVSGDMSNALLQITTDWEVNADAVNTVNVYGLLDGSANEDWPEGTTSYSTAPGIIAGEENTIGVWSRDTAQVKYLGSMVLTNVGTNLSDPAELDLSSFLADDTDGRVTLFITTRDGNHWASIKSKESSGGAGPGPTIVFPSGITIDPDSDADGLTDTWEIDNFGNLSQGAGDDPDGDQNTNAAEEAAGTDPNDANSWPDSDGDGLNDGWEIATFGNLTTATASDTDGDGLEDSWEVANFGGAPSGPIVVANTATPVTVNNTAATVGGDGILFTSASFDMGSGNAVAILVTTEGAAPSSTHSMTFAGQLMNEVWAADPSNTAQTAAIYYLVNPGIAVGTFEFTLDASYAGTVDYAYSAVSLSGVSGFADSDTANSTSTADTTPLNVTYTTTTDGGYVLGCASNNDWNDTRILSIDTGNPDTDLMSFTRIDTSGHFHTSGDIATAGTYVDGYLGQYQRTAIATAAFDALPIGFDPLSYNGTDDPDGDGFDNEAEETAGTDPTNAADYPGAGGTPIEVSSASMDTGTNTFSMDVTGLVNGNTYHVESLIPPATTFSAVAGSEFTASTDPETVNVTADEDVNPTALFRIQEGPEPAP